MTQWIEQIYSPHTIFLLLLGGRLASSGQKGHCPNEYRIMNDTVTVNFFLVSVKELDEKLKPHSVGNDYFITIITGKMLIGRPYWSHYLTLRPMPLQIHLFIFACI